jgi:hypothetical protein
MKKSILVLSLVVVVGGSFFAGSFSPANAQAEQVGEIAYIEVSPKESNLEKGSGQQFRAQAYDSEGNPVEFSVVWATTGGMITQDGFYTATQGGCHQIFAIDHDSGITGEATVVVNCGEEGETCLAVIPSRVTIHVGDQIQFAVYEKSNSGIAEEVECNWYASGGEITHQGLFTADKLGSFTITAVELDTGKMGSAHVVVEGMHVLPWWAFTMMGSEWFWVMGLLLGLVAGLLVYMYRKSKS